MLAKDNQDKMLDIPFDSIEHHGNVMTQVRKFEREIEHYSDVLFGRVFLLCMKYLLLIMQEQKK